MPPNFHHSGAGFTTGLQRDDLDYTVREGGGNSNQVLARS